MGAKNCSETPRQKMINMMYLVLTAMLALNVAAETLDAFKIVDASLITTYLSFSDKNKTLINDFNRAYEISPSKVEKWRNSANEVHTKSDSLIKYIIDTKELLVKGAAGLVKDPLEELDEKYPFIITNSNDTLILERQDDLNVSPEIMLTKHRGDSLQTKIIEYKNILKSLVESYPNIIANLESSLDVEDPERNDIAIGEEKYRNWAQKHFSASPVIASITLLSKLQIDVRNAESAVLRHLYNQIDASSRKVTGLNATVIPDASYIFQGQEYRARIFLSAEDTTQDLNVYMGGNNNALPVVDNQAIFSITPDKIGDYSYSGFIKYTKPDGTEDERPFEFEFEVAKPAATISPTKMNVLYKDLENPISVSVPGVPNDKLSVSCTNGIVREVEDGWIVEPSELDYLGENTYVNVSADFNGKIRKMGEMRFRVKKVPDPVAQVAQMNSGTIDRERLRAQVGIFAKLEDFDFELAFEVTSFDMTVPSGGGETRTESSNSYRFNDIQTQILNNLGAGDRVWIENIKAKIAGNDDDAERQLSPILLTVQ